MAVNFNSTTLEASNFGVSPNSDGEKNALGLQAVYDAAASVGAIIKLPLGVLIVTPAAHSRVGKDDGTVVQMTTGDGVTWRGHNTTIKPASNKIEIFAQNGATAVTFEDIVFDNSENGVLQNHSKTKNWEPSGGVRGQGNAANCSIRQYRGGGLTIRNCEFIEFLIASNYVGNRDDNDVLDGDFIVEDCTFRGCGFGALSDSPESAYIRNNVDYANVDRINSDGSKDPGHLYYQNDRSGPLVKYVEATGNVWHDSTSSGLSIRNVENLNCTGNVGINSARGIAVVLVKSGVINSNSIQLKDYDETKNNSALELNNCGALVVGDGNLLDVRGANAWALRIRKGKKVKNPAAWADRGLSIKGATILYNNEAGTGKSLISACDHIDLTIDSVLLRHTGTKNGTRPINLVRCESAVVNTPRKEGEDSRGNELLELQDCVDTRITIDQKFTGGVLADSVNALGKTTGTELLLYGRDEFTPTVHARSTETDFVTTLNENSRGYVEYSGSRANIAMDLVFDTNAYTNRPGVVRFGGFPVLAAKRNSSPTFYYGQVRALQNVDLATMSYFWTPRIADDANFIVLRNTGSQGAGSSVKGSVFAANTSDIVVSFDVQLEFSACPSLSKRSQLNA